MCTGCLLYTSNQPDIIHVTHEKPNSIGVDDVREQLVDDIVIKPYSSKYKIYIIDEEMCIRDRVWIAEKFQSNPEIAGSPRNSFRASLETV